MKPMREISIDAAAKSPAVFFGPSKWHQIVPFIYPKNIQDLHQMNPPYRCFFTLKFGGGETEFYQFLLVWKPANLFRTSRNTKHQQFQVTDGWMNGWMDGQITIFITDILWSFESPKTSMDKQVVKTNLQKKNCQISSVINPIGTVYENINRKPSMVFSSTETVHPRRFQFAFSVTSTGTGTWTANPKKISSAHVFGSCLLRK